ncbi:MAG: hypothetical protein ACRDMH_11485 [Solirubrobacterales bacterium]
MSSPEVGSPAGPMPYVGLDQIRCEPSAWPRSRLDRERVGEFVGLYGAEGLGALPPLELVDDGEGGYVLADGWHRRAALQEFEVDQVPALIVPRDQAEDPIDAAYRHALVRSAVASKPLTRAEKRAAIQRLLAERPEDSDRAIARLVGVDHKTVGRVREWGNSPPEGGSGPAYVPPEQAAKRLLRGFEKARQARGLGFADWLRGGDRAGQRFAGVLEELYGEEAADRARLFIGWLDEAATYLDEERAQW